MRSEKYKFCWMAMERNNKRLGRVWKLAFCLGNDNPQYIRNIFFRTEKDIKQALEGNIVFIYLANNK